MTYPAAAVKRQGQVVTGILPGMAVLLQVILAMAVLVVPGAAFLRIRSSQEPWWHRIAWATAGSIAYLVLAGVILFYALGVPLAWWTAWPVILAPVAAARLLAARRDDEDGPEAVADPEEPGEPRSAANTGRGRAPWWLIGVGAVWTAVAVWTAMEAEPLGVPVLLLGMATTVAWAWHLGNVDTDGRPAWWAGAAVGLALVIAWVVRVAQYAQSAVPLGYDYGFYRAAFDAYVAHNGVLAGAGPDWVHVQFLPGLPVLHAILEAATGLSSHDHLAALYPLLAATLVLHVAVLADRLGGRVAGAMAALLTAASMAQFEAFLLLYEKNILALMLMALMVPALMDRRWVWAGLFLAGIALLHRPVLLVAVLVVAAIATRDLVRREWKPWAWFGGAALLGALVLALAFPESVTALAASAVRTVLDALAGEQASGGTFMPSSTYIAFSAAVISLALIGALATRRRPELVPVIAVGVLVAANVFGQLIFHRRFIIMLDIFVIVLGAVGLARIGRVRAMAAPIVALVLLLPVIAVGVADPDPKFEVVTHEEEALILWADEHLPANATVLADNRHGPAVFAMVDRDVLVPNLFDNPHPSSFWDVFLHSGQDDRHAMLEDFPGDVHVIVFDQQTRAKWPGTFGPPHFERVYDNDAGSIYRRVSDP